MLNQSELTGSYFFNDLKKDTFVRSYFDNK